MTPPPAVEVFRISAAKYAEFDGIGASLSPGRWNVRDQRVVYTAGSRAMAVLEAFTHLGRVRPRDYVLRQATIPSGVSILYPQNHVAGRDGFAWALTDLEVSRKLGSQWLESGSTCVLAVPSKLVPQEYNYLVNPAHPDFARIIIHEPVSYEFDERLWKAAAGPWPSSR